MGLVKETNKQWDNDDTIVSPEDYGAKLHINTTFIVDPNLPVSLDLETDENGTFVGAAVCQDDKDVYYTTHLYNLKAVKECEFIMQGGKFDIRELRSWGIDVNYDNLIYDTKVMAYCYNTTLPSYSLN